ncbi:MAG: archaeosortase A [Halobacteriaceae archaeon]
MATPVTDALAWVVVVGFAASAALDVAGERPRAERAARGVAGVTWLAFGVFWALLVPHYAFVQKSFIESAGSAIAAPLSLYVGYLVWTRRPSLLFLSRAIAVMGLIYLPFQTIEPLRQYTVETVTVHSAWLVEQLGFDPIIASDAEASAVDRGYQGVLMIVEPGNPPAEWVTPVLLACSGIGSIATVSGLVLAVREPLRKRLAALAVVVPVIYGLNIVRVAFIVLGFSKQWFQIFVPQTMAAFGTTRPIMVSYYWADRIIAQSLSVVVLLAMIWGLLRYLPGLTVYVEEVAYLLTGREIDVGERLGGPE